MPWSASILYAQGTPALRRVLAADPVLGPHLHHIRGWAGVRWPRRSMAHELPTGGLLAIPDIYAPDDRHLPGVPSDALRGPADVRLAFTAAAMFGARLDPRVWPPPAALRHVKHLSRQAGEPIGWYVCEMHGGDVEHEAAWIPGWRPGEPDRLVCHAERGRILVSAGGRPREEDGDVLQHMLEYHRLRLPAPYFAPHTGGFDWDARRVGAARPPVPRDPDDPPPHPESLWTCVRHGDLERVRHLLAAGADPNVYAHTSPLDLAARHARLDLLDLLLAAGADPTRPAPGALHEAADRACAERLLALGLPVDGDRPAYGPLVCAARRGHDAVARLLVDRGADLQPAADPHAVWFAACTGGLVWLVDLLLARGVDPRVVPWEGGQDGLVLAAEGGHLAVVERLLAAGCDLSDRTWRAACTGGSVAVIDRHLARGFPIDGADDWTPLCLALRDRHPAAARHLLAAGADPERPSHRQTPLHHAAERDLPDLIDDLLARCPDPARALAAGDAMGWTPLFAAVWAGHAACVERLLAHSARTDITDIHGRTLREAAARHNITLP